MTDPLWHPGLRIDDGPIDRQHQELLALTCRISDLAEAGETAALRDHLSTLLTASRQHFLDEEAFMVTVAYPHREEHAAEHRRLLTTLEALLRPDLADQPVRVAGAMDCVRSLVLLHLLNDDLELRPYCQRS